MRIWRKKILGRVNKTVRACWFQAQESKPGLELGEHLGLWARRTVV